MTECSEMQLLLDQEMKQVKIKAVIMQLSRSKYPVGKCNVFRNSENNQSAAAAKAKLSLLSQSKVSVQGLLLARSEGDQQNL